MSTKEQAHTATADLLAAVKLSEETLRNTLRARGYVFGSDVSVWAPEVRKELATLTVLCAVIARATGASK